MSEEKSWDHLKMLNKQQIIDYLKSNHYFNQPDLSDVKFFLYSIKSEENIKKQHEMIGKWNRSTAAKRYDEAARKFNAEKDPDKKMKILKTIAECDKEIKELIAEDKKLSESWIEIQKLVD